MMAGTDASKEEKLTRTRCTWYNAVWRWHFYAGLFCIPFIIWLSLTGTIYLGGRSWKR
jgi:hypothetical protein